MKKIVQLKTSFIFISIGDSVIKCKIPFDPRIYSNTHAKMRTKQVQILEHASLAHSFRRFFLLSLRSFLPDFNILQPWLWYIIVPILGVLVRLHRGLLVEIFVYNLNIIKNIIITTINLPFYQPKCTCRTIENLKVIVHNKKKKKEKY